MPSLASSLRTPKTPQSVPHVIVEARAGTGKTTTLIEGLRIVTGTQTKLTPSPQQKAVWDQMALSRGGVRSIGFCAFNKSIATELEQRVPSGCQAMTCHSLGFRAVRKAFGAGLQVTEYRTDDIISDVTGKSPLQLKRNHTTLLRATKQLVSLCKMNLVGFMPGLKESFNDSISEYDLDELAAHYDVDTNGDRDRIYALVPQVLERCREVQDDRRLDYDDMIWLPVVLGIPVYRYDLLLVDEAQDLNRCQQSLVSAAGDRLILCGDPRQAIYGFAGADSESMDRMERTLKETPRGVVRLPLTVTRRCGKAIVEEAKAIVPDFDAFDANPKGVVSRMAFDSEGRDGWRETVADGDMILCRVNAPLVGECFRFLRDGRKATIQGRNIGQGLISTIRKLDASDPDDLRAKLDQWLDKEVKKESARRHPSDAKLIALQDRRDCLDQFIDGQKTVDAVIARIESVFSDESGRGIKLSSIHRAKGLESSRVFLLEPEWATVPHPMAKSGWQTGQEWNLRYVAITRAIDELVYLG